MQISPEDIRWEGEEKGHQGGHNGQGRGAKKSLNRGGFIGSGGRGRGPVKGLPTKDSLPPQNGITKKVSDDIELLNTDALVKEVSIDGLELIRLRLSLVIYTPWFFFFFLGGDGI